MKNQRTCEECGEKFNDLRLEDKLPEPHPMCDKCLEFVDSEFEWQNGRAERLSEE